MEERTVIITEPDFESGDYFDAIMGSIKKVMKSIDDAIIKEAKGDDVKADIIRGEVACIIQKEIEKDALVVQTYEGLADNLKELTPNIMHLSMAFFLADIAVLALDDGEVKGALDSIGEANYSLGAYTQGKDVDKSHALLRQLKSQCASDKKHESSREAKKKVIEHYQNNSYKSKDQAAEKIKEELNLHYSIRTIRGWLTNIEPKNN